MLPPLPFLFMRHGRASWNVDGRLQGLTDMPLDEVGLAQAHAAAELLAGRPVTLIVSSPLASALRTAAVVAERLGSPIHVDGRLAERAFGAFEGLVVDEVKRDLGAPPGERLADRGLLPDDAEPWPRTLERERGVVSAWLNRCPAERLLFVSHTGLFEALGAQLCGVRSEGRHATPYLFGLGGTGWRVSELDPAGRGSGLAEPR